MIIVMLGAPGAGKGTQAGMICEKYGIPHISTGDIFRSNIKNGTELGRKAKAFMDKGQLVPDELTVQLLLDRVAARCSWRQMTVRTAMYLTVSREPFRRRRC